MASFNLVKPARNGHFGCDAATPALIVLMLRVNCLFMAFKKHTLREFHLLSYSPLFLFWFSSLHNKQFLQWGKQKIRPEAEKQKNLYQSLFASVGVCVCPVCVCLACVCALSLCVCVCFSCLCMCIFPACVCVLKKIFNIICIDQAKLKVARKKKSKILDKHCDYSIGNRN